MDHQMYSRIKQGKTKIKKMNIAMEGAGGAPMKIYGRAYVWTKCKKRMTLTPFLVIDNLIYPAVIGMSYMQQWGVQIDVHSRKVRFNTPSPSTSKKLTPGKENTAGVLWEGEFRIPLDRKITLPRRSEQLISVPLPQHIRSKGNLLIEGQTIDDAVVVDSCFAIGTDQEVTLRLGNLTGEPRVLRPHTCLAVATKAETATTLPTPTSTLSTSLKPTNRTAPLPPSRRPPSKSTSMPPPTKRTQRMINVLKQIDFSNTPKEYRNRYEELVCRNIDAFSENDSDLGECNALPHVIKLKDPSQVTNIPPYRFPHNLRVVADEYVDKLLKAGVVRASTSAFSSPLMLVRKAGAKPEDPVTKQYRLVHNYKKVNENLVGTAYPLRNLHELLDDVSSKKVHSVMDLSSGYWQQKLIDPHGASAFTVAGKGSYEYIRSPQGLATSPGYFTRLIDFVTRGLKNAFVYMDDACVSSDSFEENLADLEATLQRFIKYNLKVSARKTKLGATSINYLGFQIDENGVKPGKLKTECIKQARIPSSKKEISSFLGLCSFFRRVVPKYADIVAPLSKLTRKDSSYKGGELPEEAKQAFLKLRDCLANRPAVSKIDFSKEIILTVDSSDVAHSCILTQDHGPPEGEKIVAYASCLLKEADVKRAETEVGAFYNEKAGILWALQHFSPYLIGKHFRIRTDHRPNVSINEGKVKMFQRLDAAIADYQPFTVEYLAGNKIPADYLSRYPLPKSDPGKPYKDLADTPFLIKQVGAQVTPIRKENEHNLTSPTILTTQTIAEAQKKDTFCKLLSCALLYNKPPSHTLHAKTIADAKNRYSLNQGIIAESNLPHRIYVPESLRPVILKTYHDKSGHFGITRTLALISKRFVWENMRTDTELYVKSCDVCGQNNPHHHSIRSELRALPDTDHFNERVHLDCLTNMPKDPITGHTAVLIITDVFSGLIAAISILSPSADETVRAFLEGWTSHHSTPKTIVSDRGTEFQNKQVEELCKQLGIEHIFSSTGHSRANGSAERKVRALNEHIRKYHLKGKPWTTSLPFFCYSENTTPSVRGFSPFFLAYTREPIHPSERFFKRPPLLADTLLGDKLRTFQECVATAQKNRARTFQQNKEQFDKKVHDVEFLPGDKVFVSKASPGAKHDSPFLGPYKVVERVQDKVLLLNPFNSKTFECHVERLKKSLWRHDSTQFHRPQREQRAVLPGPGETGDRAAHHQQPRDGSSGSDGEHPVRATEPEDQRTKAKPKVKVVTQAPRIHDSIGDLPARGHHRRHHKQHPLDDDDDELDDLPVHVPQHLGHRPQSPSTPGPPRPPGGATATHGGTAPASPITQGQSGGTSQVGGGHGKGSPDPQQAGDPAQAGSPPATTPNQGSQQVDPGSQNQQQPGGPHATPGHNQPQQPVQGPQIPRPFHAGGPVQRSPQPAPRRDGRDPPVHGHPPERGAIPKHHGHGSHVRTAEHHLPHGAQQTEPGPDLAGATHPRARHPPRPHQPMDKPQAPRGKAKASGLHRVRRTPPLRNLRDGRRKLEQPQDGQSLAKALALSRLHPQPHVPHSTPQAAAAAGSDEQESANSPEALQSGLRTPPLRNVQPEGGEGPDHLPVQGQGGADAASPLTHSPAGMADEQTWLMTGLSGLTTPRQSKRQKGLKTPNFAWVMPKSFEQRAREQKIEQKRKEKEESDLAKQRMQLSMTQRQLEQVRDLEGMADRQRQQVEQTRQDRQDRDRDPDNIAQVDGQEPPMTPTKKKPKEKKGFFRHSDGTFGLRF